MKILIGNLISKLETDNPKIIEAFYSRYGHLVPGYNFIPAVKKRKWDGKKRYFKKDGTFRTGLLPRIIKDLESIGCNQKDIIFSGNPVVTDDFYFNVYNVDNYSYRDYQKEAIEAILARKRLIIESATGSGKTLIIAGMIKSILSSCKNFGKMLLLFDRTQLVTQTYDFLKSCGIPDLGINFGGNYIYGNIMLSTVQSIDKILDTHLEESRVLIIDEAHKFCNGDTSVAAIESFPNAIFRVGFTATVPKEIHGRLTLEGALGEVVMTRSMEDLIEEGSLAKPIIQIVEFDPGTKKEEKESEYNDLYERYIVLNEDRNKKIKELTDKIKESNNSSKILILVKNIAHLEKIKKLIPELIIIQGKDSIQERYASINSFIGNDDFKIVAGTNVLETGVNIKEITHMINARGMEGEIPTIQALGRAVRITNKKVSVFYYDFYDKLPYLESHSKKRIKHYEGLGLEINYVK